MNAPVDRGLLQALTRRTAGARFLMPGEWWFGADVPSVATLLGSCVAVALWHPQRRLGGMCHFLVPGRARSAAMPLDGRYGDEAIELLDQAVRYAGSPAGEYRVHLVGGANMFSMVKGVTLDIGAHNAEEALALLHDRGYAMPILDVGGTQPRRVELDMASGRLQVRAGG